MSVIVAHENVCKKLEKGSTIWQSHGPLSNKVGMEEELTILKKIVAIVESELFAGKTPEQIVTHLTIQGYDASHGQGFLDTKTFIDILCSALN